MVRTQVEGEQHLFIEAFSDPNCVESSAYGFMSFKLNTCTPAWMFSYENQQVYLKNTAYQKVRMSYSLPSFYRLFFVVFESIIDCNHDVKATLRPPDGSNYYSHILLVKPFHLQH